MKNKHNLITRAVLVALALMSAFAFSNPASAVSSAAAGTGLGRVNTSGGFLPNSVLWYNGDFNGINGLANENNTSLGAGQFASVYDDFNVTGGGWLLDSVFSDNLANTAFTGASWEIRSGVSQGNGGVLVASGSTASPVVTATGRSGFGFTEFMVQVTGLNVFLAPGHYWLNVTPIGNGTGRSFDSSTSGANAVGTPPGNNQMAFFNSNFFGANFDSTANQGQPYDFSMGMTGALVPEPTTVALLGCGLAGLLVAMRRRRG